MSEVIALTRSVASELISKERRGRGMEMRRVLVVSLFHAEEETLHQRFHSNT
jgi:hypothetical protein